MICFNKNVHLVIQRPSLGSMTEGSTGKSKILILMPRPGQEPSIYICLSPVKTAGFMHVKLEGCIVINSLIFMIVCKNILHCLILSKNYLWTKPSPNKKRMTRYIKEPHTSILIGQTGCGKSHLVLGLIEKEYKNHFDCIVIMCSTLRENSIYHAKEWIESDDKVWLVDPKDNLYQWIKKLSQLLRFFEVLFIIDDIIANENLDKRRQPLLKLSISGRHLWLLAQSYSAMPKI